ncbi:MAG: EAL domain-containing protein [Mariprofundus sp.]|nr:EAL domain-containing protein [Mariprofundus sp.]
MLLIDDDPMVRMLMIESLHEAGFGVIEASEGHAGLGLFIEHKPQLVLVDLQMPGMDGYTFCQSLRATPEGRDTPIIVVTGNDDVDSIERAYDCGATDFINKPINWPIFHHRIQYVLRSSKAMQSAQQSSNLLAEAQRVAKLGNWTWDIDRKELFVSEESYRIFGVPRVAPGVFHKLLLNSVQQDDQKNFDIALHKAIDGEAADISFKALLPNGEKKTILMHLDHSADQEESEQRIFGTFQDISEQRRAEESIRQLAYYDTITGLPNRDLFKEHLSMALHHASRNKEKIAIMFLDLDNFKRVNDSLGHEAGDKLLKIISERLHDSVRSSDLAARDIADVNASVARLGGDEFTIMLSGLHGIEHVQMIAQRILERIAEPVMLSGNRLSVSSSIGISMYPEDGDSIETLLKCADAAMYEVKSQGRNGVFFYDDTLRQLSHDRVQLESELHEAIEKDQLTLFYQPKVDTKTHEILGFEALIRWLHPKRGMISPMDFIPVAEESGLIIPMGKWVIKTACRQHQLWRKGGDLELSISVNLSAHQFSDRHLLAEIRHILQDTAMPAKYLEFEITETVLMQDADVALKILNEMKSMGLKVSIDDFGTGYSSISYLKHFPADVLKIDRAFVKDLPDDEQDATITNAIILLAKALNMGIVAEGVETKAQLMWLHERDCEQIQGYLFSPPVPADKAFAMLGKPLNFD